MDDIRIFRANIEGEDQTIVVKVLKKYVKHELPVNLTKCELHVHETIFLVHIVNSSQVQMDPAELKTMSKWPVPAKKKEVQPF